MCKINKQNTDSLMMDTDYLIQIVELNLSTKYNIFKVQSICVVKHKHDEHDKELHLYNYGAINLISIEHSCAITKALKPNVYCLRKKLLKDKPPKHISGHLNESGVESYSTKLPEWCQLSG